MTHHDELKRCTCIFPRVGHTTGAPHDPGCPYSYFLAQQQEVQSTQGDGSAASDAINARLVSAWHKEAEGLALKIGRRCVLDDGFFDVSRCTAMLEPMLIMLASAEAQLATTRTALEETRAKLLIYEEAGRPAFIEERGQARDIAAHAELERDEARAALERERYFRELAVADHKKAYEKIELLEFALATAEAALQEIMITFGSSKDMRMIAKAALAKLPTPPETKEKP